MRRPGLELDAFDKHAGINRSAEDTVDYLHGFSAGDSLIRSEGTVAVALDDAFYVSLVNSAWQPSDPRYR